MKLTKDLQDYMILSGNRHRIMPVITYMEMNSTISTVQQIKKVKRFQIIEEE